MAATSSLDAAVSELCSSVVSILQQPLTEANSGTLQHITALLDTVNSTFSIPRTLGGTFIASPVSKCVDIERLLICVPDLQLRLISDIPLLKAGGDISYWCRRLLQSTYACFKALRFQKLLHSNEVYACKLTKTTCECLSRLSYTTITDENLFLILLRIAYACLSGLPIQLLDVDAVSKSLIPYFNHPEKNVRLAARNSAQSLIAEGLPLSVKQRFILTKSDVHDILLSSGKEMPISNVLRLLLSFSAISDNLEVIKAEGGFLFAVSIACCSQRNMETKLAFALMQSLSVVQKGCASTTHPLRLGTEVPSTPVLSSLYEKLEAIKFPLATNTCADIQLLLQEALTYELSLEVVQNLVHQPLLQALTVIQEKWEDFEQMKLLAFLVSSLFLFWMKYVTKGDIADPISPQLLESLQMVLCTLRFPGRASDFCVSKNASQAIASLLALVIKVLEFPLVSAAVSTEALLDSIQQFLTSSPSEVRVLALVVASKIYTSMGNDAEIYKQLSVTVEDVGFIVSLINDQQGLPVSSELFLTLVLILASVSDENRQVLSKPNVIQMLKSLPQCTPNLVSFQQELDKCLRPEHIEMAVDNMTEVVLTSSSDSLPHNKSDNVAQCISISTALMESVPKLIHQAEQFKNTLLEEQFTNRDPFVALADSLADVEEKLIAPCVASVELESFQRLCRTIVGIMCELLPIIQRVQDKQLIKWNNFILSSLWGCILLLKRNYIVDLGKQLMAELIDPVLQAITLFDLRRVHEFSLRSLDLCLIILEDMLYNVSTSLFDLKLLEVISRTLMDSRVIELEFLRHRVQFILCSTVDQDQGEKMQSSLTVTSKLVTEYIKPSLASAINDCKDMLVLLRKIIALARFSNNRLLMRQNGLLEVLEVTLEKFTGSEVEDLLAELICTLLSDDLQESSPTHDPKVTKTDPTPDNKTSSGEISSSWKEPFASLEEPIQCNSSGDETEAPSSHIHFHAKHILALFSMASQEFEQVLCKPDAIVSVKYLIDSTEQLVSINEKYDQHEGDPIAMTTFGEQVLHLSCEHLPNLACISFKAMKDFYSHSMTDTEKTVYLTALMKYLLYLHGCVEYWSRMQASMQQALVDYGMFHLLLNEFHTVSTTTLVQSDCVYIGLSTLYNVVLNRRLAPRFRIVVTKKLLNKFLSSQDAGIRFLAKFSMSCLYSLLSATERSLLNLDVSEVSMIARCLNGVDKFFGGRQALLETVDHLAHCPENWDLFVNAGIVHTLVGVALNEEGCLRLRALSAILNMLPEEDIPDGNWKNKCTREKLFPLDPVNSCVTSLIVAMPAFMMMINNSSSDDEYFNVSRAIYVLTRQTDCPDISDIGVLYHSGRYCDCWRFCNILISKGDLSPMDRHQVLLLQAKSAYQNYCKEIGEQIEQDSQLPGFEYKKLMHNYCKRRVLPVIKALTSLKEKLDHKLHVSQLCSHSSKTSQYSFDEEAVCMLDKALLDFMVFNNGDVHTCLLCHKQTKKLIFSHYIPKSILEEFVKALGLDPGTSIFIFRPGYFAPDWQFKPVSKVAFSMLCDTCDNQVLSKDERLFKNRIFNKVYNSQLTLSYFMACSVPYQQYLYRFAAGLLFRCMAPLYSGVCSEIGNFASLHAIMRACRHAVLHPDTFDSARLEMYLFFLPFELPSSLPAVAGWEIYVQKTHSPYCAYKLLQPGEPMVPKRLYCCMVKIGVFLFVCPVERELKDDLAKSCKSSQIQFNEGSFVMHIPDNDRRQGMIPRKLYWSLMGWAKLEMRLTKSVEFAMDPLMNVKDPQARSQLGMKIRAQKSAQASHSQLVEANLLPPGFNLNFDKHGTLPEQVIEVPPGHVVLLHHSFPAIGNNSQCFAALGRLESDSPAARRAIGKSPKKHQPAVYSVLSQPYVLIYMQNPGTGVIVKVGFYIDEQFYHVAGPLPGGPAQSKGSESLQELIGHVPRVVCELLRSKGFRSLGSLLFWHDSLRNLHQSEEDSKFKITCALDIKCREKCLYCDMRCDFCFTPCLSRHKYDEFPHVGVVQSCTESCTSALFAGNIDHSLEKMTNKSGQFVPFGHEELLRGCFSVECDDTVGLKTTVIFSLCQSVDLAKNDNSPFNVPTGLKYIKLWQRSLRRPYLVEYTVDEHFNPIAMLDVTPDCISMPVFSPGEEVEMMHQFHQMLVRIGIPYHVMMM